MCHKRMALPIKQSQNMQQHKVAKQKKSDLALSSVNWGVFWQTAVKNIQDNYIIPASWFDLASISAQTCSKQHLLF